MRELTITYTAKSCSIGECSFCVEKSGMGHCEDYIVCTKKQKEITFKDNQCGKKFPDWCPMKEV